MAEQSTHPDTEEEEEEALSLCGLLLDHESPPVTTPPRPSSDPFEFDLAVSKMCPAEDIILCGKLVPFRDHNYNPSQNRRRSESLSGLPRSNSSAKAKAEAEIMAMMMRNSKSLDCRRVQRSPAPEMERRASTKPPWYMIVFKVSPEMDLRDIKSRQLRRSPSSSVLFPSPNNNSSSWGLLRALSCKDHTAVAAATPFNLSSLHT